MKCSISNCNHHIRRGINSQKILSDSWKKYGICVCCAIELKYLGELNDIFSNSSVCSRALRLEKLLNSKNGKKELEFLTRDRSPANQVTIYE